jgi:hypothetical protein
MSNFLEIYVQDNCKLACRSRDAERRLLRCMTRYPEKAETSGRLKQALSFRPDNIGRAVLHSSPFLYTLIDGRNISHE